MSAISRELLVRTATDLSERVQSGVKMRIKYYNFCFYSSSEHFSHGTGGLHQIGGRDHQPGAHTGMPKLFESWTMPVCAPRWWSRQVATTTEQPFGGRDICAERKVIPFGGTGNRSPLLCLPPGLPCSQLPLSFPLCNHCSKLVRNLGMNSFQEHVCLALCRRSRRMRRGNLRPPAMGRPPKSFPLRSL